jgi:hypothetical protein
VANFPLLGLFDVIGINPLPEEAGASRATTAIPLTGTYFIRVNT